jgi:hypothetical protein
MRRSRFTEAQIVGILKEHESATFRHQEWVILFHGDDDIVLTAASHQG